MIRLYVPFDLSADATVALEGDQSRYLVSVMRRGVGDEVALFNGRDGEWRAVIAAVAKRAIQLTLEDQLRPQTIGPDLDLVIALVKRTRLETIIEKAAELGARRVRPVVTARTNAETARVARLSAIAMEAAEQTGRLDVPEIAEPVRLDALLRDWDDSRRLLFCDEGGEAPPVLAALAGQPQGPWAILIGPEGGFSPEERARLRELSYAVPASLGPRILRADTAAISAMTLWQAALGDSKA
jgi:16S rRNA (uracil1498-N3)-methyltransferase